MHWLDKYIEEQKEQKELLDNVCKPLSAAELVELVESQE